MRDADHPESIYFGVQGIGVQDGGADPGGAVYRCSIGSCKGAPEAFADTQAGPDNLAQDNSYVYWGTATTARSGGNTSRERAPLASASVLRDGRSLRAAKHAQRAA